MKLPRISIATLAAIVTFIGINYGANAGDYRIAASPKYQQLLNERHAQAAASKRMTSRPVKVDDGIAASPKFRQALDERSAMRSAKHSSGHVVVGYRATGQDGITASPKLRQQLDERTPSIVVAPVK
jgi:hypothetical protein